MWLRSLPTPLLVDLVPLLEIMKIADEGEKLDRLRKQIRALPSPHYQVAAQVYRMLFIGELFHATPPSLIPLSATKQCH